MSHVISTFRPNACRCFSKMLTNCLWMIENKRVNVKTHKIYQLIAESYAESYARAEGLYNAYLTFMNVANSKQGNFSTGC